MPVYHVYANMQIREALCGSGQLEIVEMLYQNV